MTRHPYIIPEADKRMKKQLRILRKAIRAQLSKDWSYNNHGPEWTYNELQQALIDAKKGEYFIYGDTLVRLRSYCEDPTIGLEVMGSTSGETLHFGINSSLAEKLKPLGTSESKAIDIYKEKVRERMKARFNEPG